MPLLREVIAGSFLTRARPRSRACGCRASRRSASTVRSRCTARARRLGGGPRSPRPAPEFAPLRAVVVRWPPARCVDCKQPGTFRRDRDDEPARRRGGLIASHRGLRQRHLLGRVTADDVRRRQKKDDELKHDVDQRRDVEAESQLSFARWNSHPKVSAVGNVVRRDADC